MCEIVYKGYIYMYTFPNGKVYIGQTRRDPAVRHREHLDPKTGPTNPAFWAAYKEQGEPKYEIIEELHNEDRDELARILNKREEYLILLHQSIDPRKGYNLKLVGDATGKKENKLLGISQYYAQELLHEKQRIFNSVVKKLKHIDTMTEEELQLYHRCFGHNNIFGGMEEGCHEDEEFWLGEEIDFAQFILEEDMRIEAEDYVHENAVSLLDSWIDEHTVFQLDDNENVLAKFDSQNDAALAMGAKNSANINNVLRGKQQRAYGYRWVYAMKYLEEQDKLKQ